MRSDLSAAAKPAVSVVIPVKDEALKIRECIDAILMQTIQVAEIIVLDSGSTDGTLEIVSDYPKVRVIMIPPSEFNHGETRNVGVRAATSDWVVLTVGDARAADSQWIEKLLIGVDDEQVIAVCGTQVVPHDADANPIDWYRPVSAPEIKRFQFASAAEFDALPPEKKKEACGWDDVSALYRRDALLRIPFRRTPYGEDALWAKDALRAGHALVYRQDARVFHYHNESADFTFRRTLIALCLRYQNFGHRPSVNGTIVPALRTAARVAREGTLSFSRRMHWIAYNLRNQRAARSAINSFDRAIQNGDQAVSVLCDSCTGELPVPGKSRGKAKAG